jgi:hypothetical protein
VAAALPGRPAKVAEQRRGRKKASAAASKQLELAWQAMELAAPSQPALAMR